MYMLYTHMHMCVRCIVYIRVYTHTHTHTPNNFSVEMTVSFDLKRTITPSSGTLAEVKVTYAIHARRWPRQQREEGAPSRPKASKPLPAFLVLALGQPQ